MDAYERLLTLARLERELAEQEDFEGLERLDAERRQIVATLPAKPPEAARPLLVEMAQLQAATTAVLKEAQSRVTAEMGSLDRREQTARGYGRQATPQRGTFTAAA
jgi:hypothetical protein